MTERLPLWPLQAGGGNQTPNGTNVSEVLSNPKIGPVGEFLHGLGVPGYKVLGAIITFIVSLLVLYTLGRAFVIPFVDRLLNRRGLDIDEKHPLLRLTKLGVAFLALGFSFRIAGYGDLLTSLAAIGAAATLAIGFALKDTLANFVSGMFIYTDRPFRIGDWIEWNDGGDSHSGVVKDITFRVTRVHTFDNRLLTVPNSLLTEGVISNPTANDELRIDFNFGIGYDDDIKEATDIIIEEAKNHPDILDDPTPTVRMTESPRPDRGALADSYVGLTSRFWIANPNRGDYLKVRSEFITAVKNRFDAVDIDMPDPQIDLAGQSGRNPPVRYESPD